MLGMLSKRSPVILRLFLTAMSSLTGILLASAFSVAHAQAPVASYPHPARVNQVADVSGIPEAGNRVTVQGGETLSGIAGGICGTPDDWTGFYAANRGIIRNPDVIFPGQALQISCTDPGYTPPAPPPPAPRHASVSVAAVAAPASPAQAAPAQSYTGSGAMQQCIISRESQGNPRAVNPGSGAGGLYQFLPSTWHALGYSGLPEDAPVWEQNQAFAKEVAQDGGYSAWTPYDGC